jgi:hypothetical protein
MVRSETGQHVTGLPRFQEGEAATRTVGAADAGAAVDRSSRRPTQQYQTGTPTKPEPTTAGATQAALGRAR